MDDPTGLSRVELEHVLARDLCIPDPESAERIRVELAGRVWQNVNPYAEWRPAIAVTGRPQAPRG